MDQEAQKSHLSPIAPSFSSQAPKTGSRKQKLLNVLLTLLVLLALALAAASIMMVHTKADKDAQAKELASVKTRLAKLEAADTLAEKQVDSKAYQAVFLDNGQAYFGKITTISKDTIILEDIFYLNTGTVDKAGNPTAGANVSLVKLGGELHKPEDKMVIERKNNAFWENIKSDGAVAKAIKEYKAQHPA
jgi:hypothetical protein